MKIFILEDDDARITAFEHVLNANLVTDRKHDVTFCKWLNGKDGAFERYQPPYDLILLDHDLGGMQYVESDGEEETGYKFVKWMVALKEKLYPSIGVIIHSYNPTGAMAMQGLLIADGWTFTIKTPFGSNLLKYLESL